MDGAASGLLESVTYKALHAQNFNRASSKASQVLTDLLSRYFTLLASTCTRYAEHAGRGSVSIVDAVGALGEIGVSLEELTDYVEGEGLDMTRYAPCTARRLEELALLKEALDEGRRIDYDDAVPLVYARLPDEDRPLEETGEAEESEDDHMDEDVLMNHINGDISVTNEDARFDERMKSPVLPPSPVSRPVSPSRKRPRLANWNPPPHIPDFLPPFPTASVAVNGASTGAHPPQPQVKQETEASTLSTADMAERDRIPTMMPQQLATAASAADYLTPVPYSMSSLSSIPESHLPDRPLWRRSIAESGNALQLQPRKHQVSEVGPALMGAYHHLLTNPSPRTPSTNPARHRVALMMMAQAYMSPRWTPPDSMFGDVAAPRPRIVAPGPTYPVPLGTKKEEQLPLPPSASKTIAPSETVVTLTSQDRSRIPNVSRATLPATVVLRASRINPPPPLVNSASGEKFLYGSGVPAPWNANTLNQSVGAASGPQKKKGKGGDDEDDAGKGKEESVLGDAMLLATWDWEAHDYRMPPAHTKRTRALGSFSLNGSEGGAGGGEAIRRNSIKIGKTK